MVYIHKNRVNSSPVLTVQLVLMAMEQVRTKQVSVQVTRPGKSQESDPSTCDWMKKSNQLF